MKKLRMKSTIGKRGQVVIPKPIRDLFKFHPNNRVYFYVEGNRVVMEKKSSKKVLKEFFEAVQKKKLPKNINWDSKYYSQFK